MNEIKGTVITICATVVVTEIICKLIPKNKMIIFVRSLLITTVFISGIYGLIHQDIDFNFFSEQNVANEELTEYVEEQYQNAVQTDARQYIRGLLEKIQIEPKEIEVFTDINEDGSILIEKVSVTTSYESDRERAFALLKNTMGDEFDVEVKADGS